MKSNRICTSLVGWILCTMTFITFSCDENGIDPIDLGIGNGSYTINNGSPISIESALIYNGDGAKTFALSHEKISNLDTPPASYIFIDINASDIGKEVVIGNSSVTFTYDENTNCDYAKSGSISITQTDNKYSINFNITLSSQNVIKGNYEGTLGNMDKDPRNNDDDNPTDHIDPYVPYDPYVPTDSTIDGVTVSTFPENEINGNTATVNGNISITNADIIILEHGFCYAPTTDSDLNYYSNLAMADFTEDAQKTSHNFACTISGLKIREWQYRAYAIVSKNNKEYFIYGEIFRFSITENGGGENTISLNIGQIEDIGSDYVYCTASIESSQQITDPKTFFADAQCGFCYCSAGNTPTIDNSKIDCTNTAFSMNNGTFSGKINDLTGNTQYVVRAYLTNNGKTVYSEERNFQTHEGLPKDDVSIKCTNSSTTSLTISVIATINSQSVPTAGGLCYSTTETPTIENSTLLDCMEQAAAGDGRFTATIQNLTPGTTYHVRGYMTLGGNTIYSNEVIRMTEVSKE